MADLTQNSHVHRLSVQEEENLISRINAGDQVACAGLVKHFGPRMMTIARRFMRCDDDCNDALQDAFFSVFRSLPSFEASARLSTWVHRITVNSCLLKLRCDPSRKEMSIEELSPASGMRGLGTHQPAVVDEPSTHVEFDEMRAIIHEAIEQLPESDRAVLMLRDIEEMDTAATAAQLETSEHNVKRRLRRARQALAIRLERAMGDDLVCSSRLDRVDTRRAHEAMCFDPGNNTPKYPKSTVH